jgi:hypothetical protein
MLKPVNLGSGRVAREKIWFGPGLVRISVFVVRMSDYVCMHICVKLFWMSMNQYIYIYINIVTQRINPDTSQTAPAT